jgi:PAS domain S-box-containing protein
VSDAFVALDKDWRYTYVNRQGAALFGRTPADLIGRHIWTEFPEGVGQPFHLAYEKAMAEQVYIEIENYFEPWERWFENRIYPSPGGVSIFFHEITDRKRAEQVARDNAALLEGQNRVLENIAHGAPLEHTLDMLLRDVEAQCPDMVCSILLPDDEGGVRHAAAPRLPAAFRQAMEGDAAGACASAFAKAALHPEAIIVEDIAASPLWSDCRAVALEHGFRASWSHPILDAHGCVLGTFAVYAHAPAQPSDRHRFLIAAATHTAATALVNHRETAARAESEARLRMAVTGGNVGIWEWDVVRDRIALSDQLRAMFDWHIQSGELTLADVMSRIHREDRPRIEEALRQSVAWGVDYDVEYRVVGPGGAVRWLANKGSGEYAEGSTPIRMIGIALDITTRKETELKLRRSEEVLEHAVVTRTAELHEKNRELEDEIGERRRVGELLRSRNEELKAFAYTVSHDLKAPLRGIAGYAQELHRRHAAGLDDRARLCLDRILGAARNLDRLIEDLLHYSRLDAETPTPIDVDLGGVLEAILGDRRLMILEHQAEIGVDLAAATARVWERGLTQALTNLIDNALKYSRDAAPPRLQIRSMPVDGGVRLAVSDNGIGFDMRYHDSMFGLFNRLVRQEDYEGTGAGLAIVRKVVEKMGGRVWAESSPGCGATFLIELPATPSRDT